VADVAKSNLDTPLPLTEEEKKQVDVMKAELFALKSPSQEVNSADMEIVPKENGENESPPVTVVTTSVRICFLGWMEFYDDWVELNPTAGRLAPLNVKSQGNRGDNFIREEVKFLSKFWEKKKQSATSTDFAFSPQPALVSPFYASIVNKFFLELGMSNFHKLLHERAFENSNLSKASNMKLIVSLGLCAEVLSKSFFDYSYSPPSIPKIAMELLTFVERYLQFLLQEELRATKTEVLEQILVSFEQILKAMGVDLIDVSRKVDQLWVNVALECIRSPYLNRYCSCSLALNTSLMSPLFFLGA
jgi:hypothetical protein